MCSMYIFDVDHAGLNFQIFIYTVMSNESPISIQPTTTFYSIFYDF